MSQFDVTLNNGNLDAQEQDDNSSFSSSGTFVYTRASTSDFARLNIGFVFPGVTVPQGATVSAATLEVWVTNAAGTDDDPELDIYGEAADNAANFATTAYVSARARTSANVSWSATNVGVDAYKSTPDITAVVQEILGRAGWSSGNNMGILFVSKNNSTGKICGFRTYDESAAHAAKLHITYTAGAAAKAPPPFQRKQQVWKRQRA